MKGGEGREGLNSVFEWSVCDRIMYHPKFQLPIDTVTARIKVLLQRLCSKFPPPKTQNGSREKTVSNHQNQSNYMKNCQNSF